MGRDVAGALNGGALDDGLGFALDAPIPDTVEIGRGAILLVRGSIAPSRGHGVRDFLVELDGERQSFDARGEIRFDLPARFGRRPRGLFLPVRVDRARAGTRVRLRVIARLRGGESVLVDQPIAFVTHARRPERIDTPIAICLATYNPDPALLRRQLDSIRAQTRRDFTCLIHDDGSRLERWAAVEELARGDERFRVFRAERNRGFYRNFEAALALVPSSTPYVALSDQDDVWYPDKLEACIARLDANPRAQLVYSDMRIVRSDGEVLAPTYWTSRRNNFTNLDTLLLANTVTGAASLFRGALLEVALPFPPEQGPSFHDHWLACAGFVAGGLEYVDRPLYDYTQHAANVIGHSSFGPLTFAGALRRHGFNVAEMLLKPWRTWTNLWSMLAFYHFGYRRVHLIAETLRLRLPEMADDVRAALALYDDRGERALDLMTRRHAAVLARGDTTDMAEFKMGMGMLLHRSLAPLLPSVVGWKDRLLRS